MFKLIIVCNIICSAFGEFYGPFLLWGRTELNNENVPALEMIDDDFLQNLYSESASILIFMKNISTALNEENFPIVKKLLNENNDNQWMYLPQIRLQSNPIDFNLNVQVIHLMGSASEQDLELSTVYKNAINIYGNDNVLAILANRLDNKLHKRREIADETINLTSTHHTHTHSPHAIVKNKHIFLCKNDTIKTMLYTSTVPILMDTDVKTKLESVDDVQGEYKDEFSILIVTFNGDRNGESVNIIVRFRFTIRNGYWSLNEAEVQEDDMTNVLTAVNPPIVPMRFSYVCNQRLRFKNETMTLILENVQIQPEIENNPLRFNDPIDCVGFTTAPIWSGIFVSSILLFVLTIAITCIMDIKSPNRFETIRSKQLQFITQE